MTLSDPPVTPTRTWNLLPRPYLYLENLKYILVENSVVTRLSFQPLVTTSSTPGTHPKSSGLGAGGGTTQTWTEGRVGTHWTLVPRKVNYWVSDGGNSIRENIHCLCDETGPGRTEPLVVGVTDRVLILVHFPSYSHAGAPGTESRVTHPP